MNHLPYVLCCSLLFVLVALHPQIISVATTIDSDAVASLEYTILYVDTSNVVGPWDGTFLFPFQFIEDALDATKPFDTIYIRNGTYNERFLHINKPLTLQGEHQQETIIDAGHLGSVFIVNAPGVHISNLTLRNTGGYPCEAGIIWRQGPGMVSNCTLYHLRQGIISDADNITISDCTIAYAGKGIVMYNHTKNSSITNTLVYHCAIGIYLHHTQQITIHHGTAHSNGIAIFCNYVSNISLTNCMIRNNSDNHGGVIIRNSNHVQVFNSVFYHNGMGINAINSQKIDVSFSDFIENTHFAFYAQHVSCVHILSTRIENNLRYGLYFIENSKGRVHKCHLSNNMLHELYVKDSSIHAAYNYWGSLLRPRWFESLYTSRISFAPRQLRIVPWMVSPWEHVGATQSIDASLPYPVNHSSYKTAASYPSYLDSDGDGVPDWWEIKYGYCPYTWDDHANLDPDQDGLNNIEEYYMYEWGADPFHKDIFLKIQWMASQTPGVSNKPSQEYLNKLINIFEAQNIHLHIDTGELGQIGEIPHQNHFSFADMVDIYWDYFLNNDPNHMRKGVFHYAIICDYGPDVNFPFVGWDHLDSMLISAEWLQVMFPYYSRDRLIVGAIAHQLGSTLGLLASTHGGNDNLEAVKPGSLQWWKFRNYQSCMNYFYKYKTFEYSDGTHGPGDFNDWGHMNLEFFKNSFYSMPCK